MLTRLAFPPRMPHLDGRLRTLLLPQRALFGVRATQCRKPFSPRPLRIATPIPTPLLQHLPADLLGEQRDGLLPRQAPPRQNRGGPPPPPGRLWHPRHRTPGGSPPRHRRPPGPLGRRAPPRRS